MAGLFDIFTNTNAQDAANAQVNGINTGLGALGNAYGQAGNQLQGYGQAAQGNINQALPQATGAISGALPQATGALTSNYMAGMQPFMQNYAQAQQGTGALGNALGLGGPQGIAQAQQAFQQYLQPQLQIGSENLTRQANAVGGGPTSGAALGALQKYGQDVASQGWNNYISQLQPYLGAQQNAAQGIGGLSAGLGSGLAGAYTGAGQNLAGLYSGAGSQLAGINQGTGQGLAGISTGMGNAMYGGLTSAGNAQANADLANNQASANMWGALLGGGMLGTKLYGMFK